MVPSEDEVAIIHKQRGRKSCRASHAASADITNDDPGATTTSAALDVDETWLKEVGYRQKNWTSWRRKVTTFVEMQTFEYGLGVVIMSNCVLIIIETDVRATDEEMPQWLLFAAQFYLMLYTAELAMRIYAYRSGFFDWKSDNFVWNMIDFVIVGSDLANSLVGLLPTESSGGTAEGGTSATTASTWITSTMRVFRLVRLLRFIRVLYCFNALSTILKALISSIMAIFWAAVVLFLMLTIWSIIAVEIIHPVVRDIDFGDCERCNRAYGSVSASVITFTKTVIAGDSWGQIAIPVMEESPFTASIFVGVMVSVSFGMLNLMVATIVKTAEEAERDDIAQVQQQKEMKAKRAKRRMAQLCSSLDIDGSGQLSLDELRQGAETNAEFELIMRSMDISGEDMELVFQMMDEDKSGSVSYDEFIDQLHKMKSQDTNSMLIFMKAYLADVRQKVDASLQILKHDVIKDMRVVIDLAAAKGHADSNKLEKSMENHGLHERQISHDLGEKLDCAGVPMLYEKRDGMSELETKERQPAKLTPKAAVIQDVDLTELMAKVDATHQNLERLMAARLTPPATNRASQWGQRSGPCRFLSCGVQEEPEPRPLFGGSGDRSRGDAVQLGVGPVLIPEVKNRMVDNQRSRSLDRIGNT